MAIILSTEAWSYGGNRYRREPARRCKSVRTCAGTGGPGLVDAEGEIIDAWHWSAETPSSLTPQTFDFVAMAEIWG